MFTKKSAIILSGALSGLNLFAQGAPTLTKRDDGCPADKPAFFTSSTNVGKDNSGAEFCTSKWNQGIFPRHFEARADDNCLRWIKIGYNDGSEETFGTDPGVDWHKRVGVVEWDPWVDTFTTFQLSGDGWEGGVGRVVLANSNGQNMDVGKYWDNPPIPVDVDRGQGGVGMLLGFHGWAGDCIDGLEPYFSNSKPDKVRLTGATFDPTYEALNALPFEQRMMEAIEASHELINNRQDQDVTLAIDLYITTETQTKVTWGHDDSHQFGGEVGVTVGGEVAWDVGIPKIGSASSKVSAEVSGKYVDMHIDTILNGKEDTDIKRAMTRFSLSTTVKAGGRSRCTVVAMQSRVNLGYQATLEHFWQGGQSYTYTAAGNFQNSLASEAVTFCEDTDDSGSDQSGAIATDAISESGTYCPDGTRVGDVGMSDADFLAACPL